MNKKYLKKLINIRNSFQNSKNFKNIKNKKV